MILIFIFYYFCQAPLSVVDCNVKIDDKTKKPTAKVSAKENKSVAVFNPDQQLLGKDDIGELMVPLGESGFYCTRSAFDRAIISKTASVFARHMIDGVFHRDEVIKSSLSGNAPRAQGPERLKEKVNVLHVQAVRAIIGELNDFSFQFYIFICCP